MGNGDFEARDQARRKGKQVTNTQFERLLGVLEHIAGDAQRIAEACERCEARATEPTVPCEVDVDHPTSLRPTLGPVPVPRKRPRGRK